MQLLKNKTVFITGGLSGIGKACALLAAEEGATIIIADLPSEMEAPAMQEIKNINSTAVFMSCNVANFTEVQNTIEKVVRDFGKLDIALNNAGIGGEAHATGDMTEAAWAQVIGVNLTGVFNCMRHELAQMAKQEHGIIVNMSSILGKVGFASSCHYVAAKHGVLGLTQTAALEYAEKNIRINAICPGFIATPLLEKGGIHQHSDIEQHIMQMHPMKRFGTSEEIASAFLFLCTPQSSFMTGSALEMDGGFLAQ
ncbi:MAG TPA: SDR family oxidoreductase [Chitinophagaceae bacterium]|nr:SDR family oxidoreductase [Chitinophagaceae bacterium]